MSEINIFIMSFSNKFQSNLKEIILKNFSLKQYLGSVKKQICRILIEQKI